MTVEEGLRSQTYVARLQEEDLDQVVALGLSSTALQTGTDSPQFYSRETLSRWIKSPHGILLVAMTGGNFAGFSITSYNPDSRDGYIHSVDVVPEFQNIGIGSQLIERTLEELERTDCNHVYCLVKPNNEPSLLLFRKFGFQVGETFNYTERELPRHNSELQH